MVLSGVEPMKYELNEDNKWEADVAQLTSLLEDAKKNNIEPRGIFIINPGNPTGTVMTRECVESVIKFAHAQRLMIIADEIYQHNIHDKALEFISFKKVSACISRFLYYLYKYRPILRLSLKQITISIYFSGFDGNGSSLF